MNAHILFIQPWDRPWNNPRRAKMYVSRAQFEVGFQIPHAYGFALLDLNVSLKKSSDVETAVEQALAKHQPGVVMVSMPVYVLGDQIGRIIQTIKRFDGKIRIVVGGGEIARIHDLPCRLWPDVTCSYNGSGAEIPALVEACLAGATPALPGVYWKGFNSRETRGKNGLLDYDPRELYTARGRVDFESYLGTIRMAGMEPMGLVEMTRGCSFQCDFCALNRERTGLTSRMPETALAETRFLAERGITYVHIIDPTLGLEREKTEALLAGLANLCESFPQLKFEVLTRPELVTLAFAEALRRAGVVRCAIGMETMDKESLAGAKKTLAPSATEKAAILLAGAGIQTKLFHIVFPGRLSEETILFLSRLHREKIPFTMQSSFLRKLPARYSAHSFLDQDQTVFVQNTDTEEQLREWMLVNIAFPSMDIAGGGDAEVRGHIDCVVRQGKPLSSLFRTKAGCNGPTVSLKGGLFGGWQYRHRPGLPVSSNLS
jgi:hypothetical protein